MEQVNDKLEIERSSNAKVALAEKNRLTDQIKILEDTLTMEKASREKWAERYEKEHKKTTELSTELLEANTGMKEQVAKVESYTLQLQRFKKNLQDSNEAKSQLGTKLYKVEAQLEEVKRELFSKNQILVGIESTNQKEMNKLNGKISDLQHKITTLAVDKGVLEREKDKLIRQNEISQANIKTLTADLEDTKKIAEKLQQETSKLTSQLEAKTIEADKLAYHKIMLESDLISFKEKNANTEMQSEDMNTRMTMLQDELNNTKDKSNSLYLTIQRLESQLEGLQGSKKIFTEQDVQTDIIETFDQGLDPIDDFPDLNEPSLVNTLTTSLGGLATNKASHKKITNLFAPSPLEDSEILEPVNRALNNTSSNMLQKYLRENKSKNRAIIEEDNSITRISYSTKNAKRPERINFSSRQEGLSPIESSATNVYKTRKSIAKRKRNRKKMKHNIINDKVAASISSKRSQNPDEEKELLKSVYILSNPDGSRPMTVPQQQQNNTSGTKYEEAEWRDSVVNIDRSEDSEFLKAHIKMKPFKNPKRGWSSKARREETKFLKDAPVRLKKQPIEEPKRKNILIKNSKSPINPLSATSQSFNRPISQKTSAYSKAVAASRDDFMGKGSIKNLIRIATSLNK